MSIEQAFDDEQDGHKKVLELAARGAPIHDILNALVRAAQRITEEGTRAAIFIVNPEGTHLNFAAASGLSESYTEAVNGFKIGSTQPSCGEAAYTRRAVIVRDVARDPLWAPYLQLAQQHGIRACWSFPLHASGGKYVGSFALYHRTPCEPDLHDYNEVRYLANIAALVIERHKEAEERALEQQRAKEALKEANRNKDVFLAMLAHELRNPLTALRMGLRVAQRAADQEKPVERGLSMMEGQLKQLDRLVEDLRDLSRVAQGKIELRMTRTELQSAVNLAVETVTPLCRSKDQKLTVDMPSRPVFLDADSARVMQMVSNLLNNACKFTEAGGNIWLTVERNDEEALIRVRDDGVGIAADDLRRIFEMFAQVDASPERARGGLGMGLTLVKSLASMHGGDVEAHSAGSGQGSEFVLRLPLPSQAMPLSDYSDSRNGEAHIL